MKKFLSSISLVLCCVCSRADTNTVDLTQIEITLDSMLSLLTSVEHEVSDKVQYTLRWELYNIAQQIVLVKDSLSSFKTQQNTNMTQLKSIIAAQIGSVRSQLESANSNLVSAVDYLRLIEGEANNAEFYIEQCHEDLQYVSSYLSICVDYLSDIRHYTESLPNIEAYQSAMSVIVSNINEHILAGINVSIPNTINVDVRNFPNFSPEWDFLSRSFQWSGWNHDNSWQEFFSSDSQDNTLQAASPMPVPATSTLADYLEKLYIGINNSGRIINDSIIHACCLLEGSNTVSQAEQSAASDFVSSSVDDAPTAMEQISSSIPAPTLGVNTSYIQRGISFWDQIGNIQKPTSIVISTSPSEGDFFSVPDIYLEVKLSDHPGLDKVLEFARSIFTWLWWLLSVLFLVWLFRRALALYSMVMSLLGPQPVQTTAVDVV